MGELVTHRCLLVIVSLSFARSTLTDNGFGNGLLQSTGAIMTSERAADLGDERFVALTTFKRNGEGVSTPMWIARDGADLFVWTPADSWKVKRVRNDPRVALVPSSRGGKVREGAAVVEGTAQVVSDPAEVDRLAALIRQKYGLVFRVVTLIETILARGRKPRVVLRITADARGR